MAEPLRKELFYGFPNLIVIGIVPDGEAVSGPDQDRVVWGPRQQGDPADVVAWSNDVITRHSSF